MTWADRLALAWARRYTRGLPDDAADRRREELTSDLHEHASLHGRSAAQQVEVLGRVLWGIPADLSWRRAARAPRLRRSETGATMTLRHVSTAVFGLYALFQMASGISIAFNPDGGSPPIGTALVAAGVLMLIGLAQRTEAPRRSTWMLSIAAAVPAFALFWMAVIFGPVGLLLIALAVTTEPGRRTPAPAV